MSGVPWPAARRSAATPRSRAKPDSVTNAAGSKAGFDHYWPFTLDGTTTFTFDSCGVSFDSVVSVFDQSGPSVLDLEELADGDTYSMVSNEYIGFAKVNKGLNIVEGRLRTADAILENEASALSPHAELLPDPPLFFFSPSLLSVSALITLPLFGSPALRR